MTMQLDQDELHRLLAALADSDIQEFRLEGDDFRLEIRRNLPNSSSTLPVATVESLQASPPPISDTRYEPQLASPPPPTVPASRADLHEVTAPMVGTFYRSPAPEEPPFVELGNRIAVGQTICILEAM